MPPPPPQPGAVQPFLDIISNWMLFRDPPDHTRLRGLVNKAFTPRRVERMRARVEAMAAELIDKVRTRSEWDVIESYALPLPSAVIAELLGIPPADRQRFHAWTWPIARAIDVDAYSDEGILRAAADATGQVVAYLREIVAERRRAPADDLISALVAAEDHGSQLDEEELLSLCVLLLGSGHETTVGLIGLSVYLLLTHPEELAALRAEPDLAASAVEEVLRYESPVQTTRRIAFEDVALDGHLIRRGQHVTVWLAAANRDPEAFPDPDRFDIRRGARGLTFSQGIHYCVGAPLARMEGEVALRTLLAALPDLSLERAEWSDSTLFRGFASLHVRNG